MKKKLITAVVAGFLVSAVFGLFTAGTALATGDGSSSAWDAVTYDDSISFTAVLQSGGSVAGTMNCLLSRLLAGMVKERYEEPLVRVMKDG